MLRNNLLVCFFTLVICTVYSQDEREIISRIDSINDLALSYYNDNDMSRSIGAFNQAIKLSDSIDDSYGNARANVTLGEIYGLMQEYDDAERCLKNALEASTEISDNYLLANAYLKLGDVYKLNGEQSKVITYYKKALEHANKKYVLDHNNIDKRHEVLFKIRMGLTALYLDTKNPSEALITLLRAEKDLDLIDYDKCNESVLSYMYGRYFVQKGSSFKAMDKFELAAAFVEDSEHKEELHQSILLSKIYKAHASILNELGENDEAYAMLLKYNEARERTINEEKIKQENLAKSKFIIAEYQRTAELATKERLLQEEITSKMQRINIITSLGVILMFFSLIMLFRYYLSKRKLSTILESRNKELEKARDAAEKSSQLKTKFISNVTHELRTPLYGVVGLTSLLLKSNDLSERDSKFLKSLKFSGDYLLNLINDILQIGKIESDKVDLQIASVNLRQLLENIIDSFEYRLQESNNEMHLLLDEKLPKLVKCDNVRLSQILINLIGNSIKFTRNGSIWIGIQVLNSKDESIKLRFSVKDNGPGIPKSKQEHIFENFSQLSDKSNIEYQGTGLGLSIAKKLVELFNSEIKLDSAIGEGSEFSFDVEFEIDTSTQIIPSPKQVASKSIPIHDRYNILVAEDNKINQIVTQNVLKKGNFESAIVENGLEAFNAIRENSGKFDLILMDLNMPVMNGVDAAKEIRKIDSKIPIIALTAADIEEVKNDFEAIGFDDVITKPFDNFEFYQKITSNIQKNKLKVAYDSKLEKVS